MEYIVRFAAQLAKQILCVFRYATELTHYSAQCVHGHCFQFVLESIGEFASAQLTRIDQPLYQRHGRFLDQPTPQGKPSKPSLSPSSLRDGTSYRNLCFIQEGNCLTSTLRRLKHPIWRLPIPTIRRERVIGKTRKNEDFDDTRS